MNCRIYIAVLMLFSVLSIEGAAEEINFTVRDGLIHVPVVVDRHVDAWFLLDTGADRIYIDSAFADSVGLGVEGMYPRPRIFRDFTTYIRRESRLDHLKVGNQRLEYVDVTVVKTDTVVYGGGLRPSGVLGHCFLKDFYVTINGPAKTVKLDERKPRFLEQEAELLSYIDYWHVIIVPVSFGDGEELQMILDYGARGNYLTTFAADRLGIEFSPGQTVTVSDVRIGPGPDGQQIEAEILPEKQYRDADRRTNFDGVLGFSYLSRQKITIDYGQQVLYLYAE